MPGRSTRLVAAAAALWLAAAAGGAQRDDAFGESRDHPAIAYSTTATDDAVAQLNARLASGDVRFTFDAASGYLPSVLDALGVPVASQVLVHSQTSFQAPLITFDQPRAIFFTDEVAVGWVPGGDLIEVSTLDARQGTIYYQLPQTPDSAPRFARNDRCLACHLSWETRAVPGPLVQTVFPRRSDREYAHGFFVDHRVPIAERWGGWYVTGRRTPRLHLGNQPTVQPGLRGRARPPDALARVAAATRERGYPSDQSDVVALLVLEHQAHATNLITRAGWEARVAAHDGRLRPGGPLPPRVRQAVDELVDYLLFVDEAPLPEPVAGASGFAEWFARQGPRDAAGRSLRDLQLETRLMRHPLSYMIYTRAFDGLPPAVRTAVYERLAGLLETGSADRRYAHLTPEARRAALEILRATKPEFAAQARRP